MSARPDQLTRIRRTWAIAAAVKDKTARVFYDTLFQLDPDARALFQGDMDKQGKKLTATLGFIIDHLEEPGTLLPAAEDLAIRHVSYGVSAGQYASVGTALISTLKQLLGADFSAEDEAAWTEIYTGLADHMVKTAYPAG